MSLHRTNSDQSVFEFGTVRGILVHDEEMRGGGGHNWFNAR